MATKNAISFDTAVSIDELRVAIPSFGPTITMIIKGEPGIGKSTLLPMLAEDNGDQWRRPGDVFPDDKYNYIYVDCPVKDPSDLGMSIPVHTSKQLEFYASGLFMLDDPRPKYIMLDEMMKAPKMAQIMYTRLALERMAGDRPLPKGSVVFGTSNNETDGVGDSMLAHAGNRVMLVRMAKPSALKWLTWASEKKINRIVRTWVAMNSRCMASYLDGGQEDNPYIFNPTNSAMSFVSPRSLTNGAHVVMEQVNKMPQNMTKAALAGSIGQSAAESMMALSSMEKEIIPTKDVIADPAGVDMPEKPAALFMMMFNAIDDLITQDDLSQFMVFINRVPSTECTTLFYSMLCQNKRTVRLAKNNAQVKEWSKNNLDMLV
jgi:hypothetical protein